MLTNLTGGTIPVTKSWCTTDSTPSSCVNDHRSQHWWASHIFHQARLSLLAQCTARDCSRLQRLQDPMVGAWLTQVPCESLGLLFNPTEFQTLLRWRLGMQLSPSSESTTPCRKRGRAQDIFGDHAARANSTLPTQGISWSWMHWAACSHQQISARTERSL